MRRILTLRQDRATTKHVYRYKSPRLCVH